jgi:hypothetical protein
VRRRVATSPLHFNFSCDVIVASPSSRLFWFGAVASFTWLVDAIVASPLTPPPHRTSFLLPFLLPFALLSLAHSAHRRRVVVVASLPIARAPRPASMAFPPSSSSSVLVRDAMTLVSNPRRRRRRQHSEGDRRASSAMAGRRQTSFDGCSVVHLIVVF